MRVKLKTHVTGTRDGVEWPAYGEEMDLPEVEAKDMIASGMAESVADPSEEHKPLYVGEARKALVPTRTMKGK